MIIVSLVLAAIATAWFLAYHCANGLAWSLALAGGVLGLTIFTGGFESGDALNWTSTVGFP